jgi:sugar phosphate isomerase/epimerase
MSFLSLTTWSLHRNLGPLHWTNWDEHKKTQVTLIEPQPVLITLLELPAILAQKGFEAVEIGHIHFQDTSEAYLHKLRDSIREAGIRFHTLLIDYGDISSGDERRRQADIAWIKGWIDIASTAGAERVRIIAGQAEPTDMDALARSAEALKLLSVYADSRGVKAITENFRPLTSVADNCLALLEACGDRLGLISDFGNFSGENKYDDLAKTVSHSDSVHAKAKTDENGLPDVKEFKQCLDIVKASGFDGPIVLVYDGPHDMWDGIDRIKDIVSPYLS